ncbi:LysR substrate-binding domain-containing protein [Billgrantia montanilacus]|uniref:LysR family transcriptional regulator n=1 Tax=Billgrantia montanilacus TaxID=2282305 RepID=A0A368U091_9GAMM|nr:LysR substrate-binding domain-containing protein [Halomonas montanilacus]RCV90428.1 LysR family transcriptional regulator [Halomonas montanilacus]
MVQQKAHHLPSLQALRAFEALARLGSLTEVADYLSLTRSAISHQLRLLESQLNIRLYERRGRGVILTPAGQLYAGEVREVLQNLERIHANLPDQEYNGHLHVCMPPGFAASVISRHINDFYAAYPTIRLHLSTNREDETINQPNFDLFVVFSDGVHTDQHVELLAQPMYHPVCSPTLLNELNITHPRHLDRATLLHLHDVHDWQLWLAGCAGKNQVKFESGIYFSNVLLVLQAALSGQGVAIGDDVVCGDSLRHGQLVRPFGEKIPSDRAYYLVTPHSRLEDPNVQAFSDWMKKLLEGLLGASAVSG